MTQQNDYSCGALAAFARNLGAAVLENEPMCRHTSFQIGGPAELFVTVSDEKALGSVLLKAKELGVPVFVVGNGSDLLVPDKGIRGAVIAFSGELCEVRLQNGCEIVCGPGATMARVCKFALENCLTGLEFAWGIPGSAGGAAYMNAGAYGGEMKDVVVSCRHLDENGEPGEFTGEALQFGYRHSAYTDEKYVITSIVFRLQKDAECEIKARMDDYISRRRNKQPLEYPSAGSVFKRPDGYYAGQLIEQCGLKGASVGGAQVSVKHAGFIINKGGATCEDVRSLIARIQDTVRREKGVSLECEIKLMNEMGHGE